MHLAAPVLRLYPALANGPFMLLWLGMMPATLAVMMNQVASPYAAFTLSQSAAVLGIVSLAQGVPMLALSLLGGVVADRLPRRSVLMGSQILQMVGASFLAILGLSGRLEVWHVVAASFVQGAAFAFNMPARQAFIAELVPRPQIPNAAALNNAGQNFCRVAGPALGGALIGIPFIGIGGAFLTMTALYGSALVALFRLPSSTGRESGRVTGASHLQEGLRYVRSSPPIMVLIGMNLVVVVFGQSYQTLMPVVAERVFGVGASGLGILLASSGIGALIGALVVASLSKFPKPAALQLGLAIGLGVSLIAFSVTSIFVLAVVLLMVVGCLFSAFGALNNTLLMANTEPRLTGRVMSIYLLTWGAMPLGSLPLASLADHAGAPAAIALAGAVVVAVVVGIAVFQPAAHRINWTPATARVE